MGRSLIFCIFKTTDYTGVLDRGTRRKQFEVKDFHDQEGKVFMSNVKGAVKEEEKESSEESFAEGEEGLKKTGEQGEELKEFFEHDKEREEIVEHILGMRIGDMYACVCVLVCIHVCTIGALNLCYGKIIHYPK